MDSGWNDGYSDCEDRPPSPLPIREIPPHFLAQNDQYDEDLLVEIPVRPHQLKLLGSAAITTWIEEHWFELHQLFRRVQDTMAECGAPLPLSIDAVGFATLMADLASVGRHR